MDEAQKQRIVFMGTPAFAASILEKLCQWSNGCLTAVYTQPDRRSGRGLKLNYSPVKQFALEHGMPVFQPESLRSRQIQEDLAGLRPDFIVVAAYGLIIPQEVLDIPVIAPINVHASLLPLYRGAAPIQRSIMENWQPDAVTGVSIMRIVRELDAGPVYARRQVLIGRHDSQSLERELARVGAMLLTDTLQNILETNLQPQPQNGRLATYAHKLAKNDGLIDWNRTAAEVDAHVRAVNPWPGARTTLKFLDRDDTLELRIFTGNVGEANVDTQPGQVRREKRGLSIACRDNWYNLRIICANGKKEMDAANFANGHCKIKNGICGQAVNSQ